MASKRRIFTKQELERAIREANMHAEFPQHRAHGMYGDPGLDKKKPEKRKDENKKD